MKTHVLYLVLILFVTNFASWLLSSYLTKRGLETKFSDVELYSIANDPELSNILNLTRTPDINGYTGTGISEEIIFQHLFTVAVFHPDIERLQGIPLTTLCKIISYKKQGGFSHVPNGYSKELTMSYLDSVEPEVSRYMDSKRASLSKVNQALMSKGAIPSGPGNGNSETTPSLPDCF